MWFFDAFVPAREEVLEAEISLSRILLLVHVYVSSKVGQSIEALRPRLLYNRRMVVIARERVFHLDSDLVIIEVRSHAFRGSRKRAQLVVHAFYLIVFF